MNILGINAYHGDAAACLVVDGQLVAAIEEERIRRVKHWAGFPSEAIRWCLGYAGLEPRDIDHVAVGRDPSAHVYKKILFALRRLPSWSMLRDRQANRARILGLEATLCAALEVDPRSFGARIHNVEHHHAHLASSFFLSPFEDAACVSVDGFGDYVSTMVGRGRGNRIAVDGWTEFPHSLGAFYTAGTQHLGFDRYGDEYKVMGLAPYGDPEYLEALRDVVRLGENGRILLDTEFFRHHRETVDTRWEDGPPELGAYYSDAWVRRFGSVRQPDEPLDTRHRHLARSLQARTEEVYLELLGQVASVQGGSRLCLAGGCAFNSVANGRIRDATPFTDVYVPPAAGDAGTSIGAAFWVWHQLLGRPRGFSMDHAYFGPDYSDVEIRRALERSGLDHEWIDDESELVGRTVKRLEAGDIVGWFQGRSEWGPRALGNRSILVDPRRPEMKDALNARIKRREPFRPFAPAIPQERAADYFERPHPAPFMTHVYSILRERRNEIPAVTHVDGSGRLQTVSATANPRFHRLITAFGDATGTPVLLNTSFNENEPIVNKPGEAIDCFRRTGMDTLVLGRALLRRPAGDRG